MSLFLHQFSAVFVFVSFQLDFTSTEEYKGCSVEGQIYGLEGGETVLKDSHVPRRTTNSFFVVPGLENTFFHTILIFLLYIVIVLRFIFGFYLF